MIRIQHCPVEKSELLKYYEQYGSMQFVLDRLENREVIRIENDIIELIEDNIKIGFKNNLMMWGTRNLKF